MPDLFRELSWLFPDASNDQINNKIGDYRTQNPGSDDQQVLNHAAKIKEMDLGNDTPSRQGLAPRVSEEPMYIPGEEDAPKADPIKDYYRQLANPEAIQSAQDRYKNAKGNSLGTVLGSIMEYFPRLRQFSGIAKNARNRHAAEAKGEIDERLQAAKYLGDQEMADKDMAIKQAAEKRTQADWDRARTEEAGDSLLDTPETLIAQHLLTKMSPEMADQIKKLPSGRIGGEKGASKLAIAVENEMNKREESKARLAESAASREQTAALAGLARQQSREIHDQDTATKTEEKTQKENEKMSDLESAKNNLDDSIDQAIVMIGQKGTSELTGPHNKNLELLYGNIAESLAKLKEPDANARPARIIMERQNLPEISAFKGSDATAAAVLAKVKSEAGKIYENRYKSLGRPPPAAPGGAPAAQGENQLKTFSSPRDMKEGEIGIVNGHKVKRMGNQVEVLE